MVSKKAVRRTVPGKLRNRKAVRGLAKKARTEVAKLLKQDLAGTITRAKLDAGLKETLRDLKQMSIFVHRY